MDHGESRLVVEKIRRRQASRAKLRIRTVQAFSKKGIMDFLIEKAQELGVEEFCPIETERSAIRIFRENQSKILIRWRRKAREAAKQSGALNLTHILSPQTFQEALAKIPREEEMALFHPTQDSLAFRQWIQTMEETQRKSLGQDRFLNLFFGPEGGFSEREIEHAKTEREKSGSSCTIVSLGENILRVETAFLGVISSLRLILG
jgi:16S rRNA (uracil1498-N3)-methyltransferase